jgi:enterochelin esterase-like enzyme
MPERNRTARTRRGRLSPPTVLYSIIRMRRVIAALMAPVLLGASCIAAIQPIHFVTDWDDRNQPVVGLSQSSQGKTGEIVEVTIPSKTYSGGRHASIYKPVGYPASCQNACNLIVVFDGAIYLGAMHLPEILDSLIAAQRTPPTVAILFDNGAPPGRISDLANSERFAGFVANELLPWAWQHFAVAHSADRTTLAGSSAGGLGAAYIALKYPSLFGNVLSQSGAFWRGNEASNAPPYEWLTQEYAKSPKINVRFFIDVGSKETVGALGGAAPSLLAANQHLRTVLEQKGYDVEYFEVPNGQHSPDTWRSRIPVGIVALAPLPSSR